MHLMCLPVLVCWQLSALRRANIPQIPQLGFRLILRTRRGFCGARDRRNDDTRNDDGDLAGNHDTFAVVPLLIKTFN